MRYLQTIALIYIAIIAGCSDTTNGNMEIKRFIPGTYVKEVKNEFMIANDTLIIQRTVDNNYLVVNKTGYQRINRNKLSSIQFSEINLQAVYNEKSKNLYDQRLGKTFTFDPQNERLFEGASEYKKVLP